MFGYQKHVRKHCLKHIVIKNWPIRQKSVNESFELSAEAKKPLIVWWYDNLTLLARDQDGHVINIIELAHSMKSKITDAHYTV